MTERVLAISMLALLLTLPLHPAFGGVTASFRYPLSNFSGPVPSQWARLAVDRERNEIYALNRYANDIRIFDEHGMEIHVFGEGLGSAADLAIGDDGDIFILRRGRRQSAVQLFDYRGEYVSEVTPKDVPAAFSEHKADQLLYRHGSLYLLDSESMGVVVLDANGNFKKGYDLNAMLRQLLAGDERMKRRTEETDWAEKKLKDVDISGFHVDELGNMLFTVPVLFSAYRLSPDDELVEFGRPGSGPGKFGVAAGIVTDERGYIYVSDRLRSVVLVFDRNLVFQTEFGYRGIQPSNLIVPDDLAIDGRGNVYVAQAANRGVSVFAMAYDEVSPPKRADAGSTDSGTYDRATREANSSERLESIVGQGGDTLPPASEKDDLSAEDVDSPDRPGSIVDRSPDTPSTVSVKHAPIVEEVYLPNRLEFIPDDAADTPSTGSGKYDPTVEYNQSNQVESVEDEKD